MVGGQIKLVHKDGGHKLVGVHGCTSKLWRCLSSRLRSSKTVRRSPKSGSGDSVQAAMLAQNVGLGVDGSYGE